MAFVRWTINYGTRTYTRPIMPHYCTLAITMYVHVNATLVRHDSDLCKATVNYDDYRSLHMLFVHQFTHARCCSRVCDGETGQIFPMIHYQKPPD